MNSSTSKMLCLIVLSILMIDKIDQVRSQNTSDPVEITVYYATLCPYSSEFITKQLQPAYEQVPEIMTIDFVLVVVDMEEPTEENPNYSFTCPHGPKECEGNLLHVCALNYYQDNEINVEYIACAMTSIQDPVAAAETCAKNQSLDWNKIHDCAYGTEGSKLMSENYERTKRLTPPLTGIPRVEIDDEYNEVEAGIALANLLLLVCFEYEGPPPPECNDVLAGIDSDLNRHDGKE